MVRIGLAAGCAGLAAAGLGCETARSLGLRDAEDERPAYYDELFEDEPEPGDPEDPKRIFKPNRMPGGLSPEARAIERESFNVF